ncbi:acyl-CoA thioesterase [Calditrichota bacterium]
MNELKLEDFPLKTYDKIRYVDTDRQGHVNNATFSSFLESGRVEILYNPEYPIRSHDSSFVIASLKLDFLKEIEWPGQVDIGTGILKIGNSSIILFQKLFQNDICVANAETIIVQVHNGSGQSSPLTRKAKLTLGGWLLNEID